MNFSRTSIPYTPGWSGMIQNGTSVFTKNIRKTPKFIRSNENFYYICTVKGKTMKQRLTAKEEEVMNILWKNGDMFIRDIVAAMPEPRPNYNTVATQVKFLEEKGFVVRRPMANSYLYSVAVSERQYRGRTVGEMVSKYYGNSYSSLVSQFVEEEKMGLDELKALIAEIENNNKKNKGK